MGGVKQPFSLVTTLEGPKIWVAPCSDHSQSQFALISKVVKGFLSFPGCGITLTLRYSAGLKFAAVCDSC